MVGDDIVVRNRFRFIGDKAVTKIRDRLIKAMAVCFILDRDETGRLPKLEFPNDCTARKFFVLGRIDIEAALYALNASQRNSFDALIGIDPGSRQLARGQADPREDISLQRVTAFGSVQRAFGRPQRVQSGHP